MIFMEKMEGMLEAFKDAKVVFLTTYSNGDEHSRPMTNLNDDPYRMIYFPTHRDTVKVNDIKENPKVKVTFPGRTKGDYYEIEGRAEFEDERIAAEKWQWWWLYWHPSQRRRFWFPGGIHPERVIINIYPEKARLVKK